MVRKILKTLVVVCVKCELVNHMIIKGKEGSIEVCKLTFRIRQLLNKKNSAMYFIS